jgi:glutathione S-transferase
MANMQAVVFDALRPAEHRNPADRSLARERLRTAYDWLEANLDQRPWAIGEPFTLADCAAAPSLFYADWVEEIDEGHPQLKAYRARLLANPVVARAVDEARAYRPFFPLGAPDRD